MLEHFKEVPWVKVGDMSSLVNLAQTVGIIFIYFLFVILSIRVLKKLLGSIIPIIFYVGLGLILLKVMGRI